MTVEVVAVKKYEFDRGNGTKNTSYKVTVCLEDGIVEVWSNNPVNKGDIVELKICAGRDYKPSVRIA